MKIKNSHLTFDSLILLFALKVSLHQSILLTKKKTDVMIIFHFKFYVNKILKLYLLNITYINFSFLIF